MGILFRKHDTSIFLIIEAQDYNQRRRLTFEMNNACGDRRGDGNQRAADKGKLTSLHETGDGSIMVIFHR